MLRRPKMLEGFELELLSTKTLETAAALCDSHVGEGLYPVSSLRTIVGDSRHNFSFVKKENIIAGYFYSNVTKAADVHCLPGLDYGKIASLCKPDDNIAIYKSLGIEPEFRGIGLSDALLLHFKEEYARRFNIALILAPCWKQGSYVPVEKLVLRRGFRFLCELTAPWADSPTLQCPYCGQQPCVCDAVVYYLEVGDEKNK